MHHPFSEVRLPVVVHRLSISAKISSAQRTESAIALMVAGTRVPPPYGASFRAARMLAAMSRTRFRPSSMFGIQNPASDLTPIGREVPCGEFNTFAICSPRQGKTLRAAANAVDFGGRHLAQSGQLCWYKKVCEHWEQRGGTRDGWGWGSGRRRIGVSTPTDERSLRSQAFFHSVPVPFLTRMMTDYH